MSIRNSLHLVLGAAFLFALAATEGSAQSNAPVTAKPAKPAKTAAAAPVPDGGVPRYIRPETPEQRRDRIGSNEDPGLDPDEKKVFYRYGKKYMIARFEKEFAKYMPEVGWVRPMAQLNFVKEIYQENDKYVWVWSEILEPEEIDPLASTYVTYSDKDIEYFQELREEFEPIEAQRSNVRVRFEESSSGLPTTGSWRNGGDVADMNEDGFVDLVLPPQRGPADVPSIFLGDGKGNWKLWKIKFPRRVNYGSVVVADFNKDRHLDMALSIHLTGVGVFLGNGKGEFREVGDLKNDHYPTRRLVATDVDADGWMDFVAITEGPVGIGKDTKKTKHGHLRAYLNRKKGQVWEGFDIADTMEYLGGDFLSAANFNGDRYPDFIGASVYFNATKTMYLSQGAPKSYEPLVQGQLVPGRSLYYGMTTARFARNSKTDDAIVSFIREWPANIDPKVLSAPPVMKISGLDRITFSGGQAKRTPILRWEGSMAAPGVGSGDFDGDGNLDIAFASRQKISLLLGDGAGNFAEGEFEGLTLPTQRSYDIKVADLNGDRRPDLVLMYESDETVAFAGKNGSVHVYLNKGKSAAK